MNFTATNQLFLANSHVIYWRFEVAFAFSTGISSSSLNFAINQPPSKGSCSISPLQGTTSTPFSVACSGWFDKDGIKDYVISSKIHVNQLLSSSYTRVSLLGYATDRDEQTILAFSSVSDFTVLLSSPTISRTLLNLFVTIRDTLGCAISVNLSTVVLTVNVSSMSQLVDQLSHSKNTLTSDSLVRLLSSGNQNTVAQLVTSVSQYCNRIDEQSVDEALSSKRSRASDALSLCNECSSI